MESKERKNDRKEERIEMYTESQATLGKKQTNHEKLQETKKELRMYNIVTKLINN